MPDEEAPIIHEEIFGQDPVPHRDGRDYDPYSPQPSFDDVLNWLLEQEIEDDFIIVAIGALGSPTKSKSGAPKIITGIANVVTPETLENAYAAGGSLQARWSRVFNVTTPFKHVSSIIIRPFS